MNAPTPSGNHAEIHGQIAKGLAQSTTVSMNIGGKILITNEDKIRLAVLTHLKRIENKKQWHAPLGVVLSVAATFVTAEFKDRWLSAATWNALFIFVGLAALIWMFRALYSCWNAPTTEDFVKGVMADQDFSAGDLQRGKRGEG